MSSSDAGDLATIVGLLEQWKVWFRTGLSVGASQGLSEHEVVEQLADALHDQLERDEMAGALATAIYVLARNG